jgi:hypothetical protein
MKMMYETVYRALKEAGLEDKYEPQDYLNFFCLGNRESPAQAPPGKTLANSNYAQVIRLCILIAIGHYLIMIIYN